VAESPVRSERDTAPVRPNGKTAALFCSAVLALVAGGCGGSSGASTSTPPTAPESPAPPSVALHVNAGDYSTTRPITLLSGIVTPGAKVTLTVTSPSQLAEGPAAAKPTAQCGGGVKAQNCEVTQTIPAMVRGNKWTAGFPVFLGDIAWQSGEVARREKTEIEAENVVEVYASKAGLATASATVTITRRQTPAQHAAEQSRQAQRLKEEEANPNSELNKNEREAEAKVKGAERQTEQEAKPYKEAEERSKNLKAKEVEEHVREEESREQRRLESEGK
jgi:flagellar biosynthesis GTPase FlhF